MRTLDRQDIEDLLVGAKIMGTGGGGEAEWAKPLIEEVYDHGKKFRLVDPRELSDSKIVVIVSRIGGGVTAEQAKKVAHLKRTVQKPEQLAFELLGTYLGLEPYAIVPTELGAGNTLAAMCTAAMLDKPTVDADCMGRAKPELQISTTNVRGVPLTPACLVTNFGDVVYLDRVLNDSRAEDLLRSIATVSGGLAGMCRCPMHGSVVRNSTVHNTISLCVEIGRLIRESARRGEDPVIPLVRKLNGVKFFEGRVSSFRREERGAFMWGEIELVGTDEYSANKLKISFKNEHLVSWLDDKPYVSCPDTICVVDEKTGRGLSNWGSDFAKGRRVVAFGMRANRFFKTKKGMEIFSPRPFGYDFGYVPIERLVKRELNR